MPYNNVIGVDPELRDPEQGDYRLALGSPAAGYGCQTFGRGPVPPALDEPRGRRTAQSAERLTMIDVSGSITTETAWNADTVRVVGDVIVEDGVTLTIGPGVRVEFQGFYTLSVLGTLQAEGAPDARILFTTDEPELFRLDESHTGCWNGIRFDETLATNEPSRLAYCIIEYSKATNDGAGLYPYGGGAVSVVGFSRLSIENCIIRHNVADYGGALFLYGHADPVLAGNLLAHNHALQNASAVYCAYSYPRLVNNTIVHNPIHNVDNPYIDSCAVLNFRGKPVFANNIIRDNDPDFMYLHVQLWENKDYHTRYNNVESYDGGENNIDADPLFVAPDGADGVLGTADDNFRLAVGSPSVDTGTGDELPVTIVTDLDGATRVIDGDYDGAAVVDMGAYETGNYDCDQDGDVDLADLTELVVCLTGPAGVLDESCTCFDVDRDADVDLSDFAGFQAVFTGAK